MERSATQKVAMIEQASEDPTRPSRRRGIGLVRQWPLGLVLAGLAASLAVVVVEDFRPGAVGFGATVLAAGMLRLVLPERLAGLLVLRGRFWDVLMLFALGTGTLVLALVVPEIR